METKVRHESHSYSLVELKRNGNNWNAIKDSQLERPQTHSKHSLAENLASFPLFYIMCIHIFLLLYNITFLLLSNLTGIAWIRRRVPQKCCSVASGLLKLCALNCWDERTMRQWECCEGLRRVEKCSVGFSFFGWCELCTRLRWYRVFRWRSCNLWVVGAAP